MGWGGGAAGEGWGEGVGWGERDGARDCLLPLCHTNAAVSDQNNLKMIHLLLFGLVDNYVTKPVIRMFI